MLQTGLKPAVPSKTRRRLSEGVILLHDNAHPAHGSDLVPSDFLLFGPLKEALVVKRFGCDEVLKNVVHRWLQAQPKTFYYDGIKKLVGRWEKYVEKPGDWVG
jgi:hypothetical protein